MPTVGSLFSGVGGFDVGFEQAGFSLAWQCEIDRDAVSVLERHWPDVPRYGDIATVDPAVLAPVDVVIFGSPCQDFSVAGKRAGLDGARSGLFGEAIRIIRGLRPAPAFCVWENVPGTLSSARGRDFGAVLDALAGAGALDIAWRILDARWFGVPQRRRRLFVVSDLGAERRAAQILFEPESGDRDSAPSGATGEGLAGDVEGGAGVVGTAPPVIARYGKGAPTKADDCLILESTGVTSAPAPAWTPCPRCEDFVCTIHEIHAHDCECPSIEEWETDPYTGVVANSVTASAGHHGHSSPRGDGNDNLIAVAAPLTAGGHPNSNAPGRQAVALRQNLSGDVYESEEMAPIRSGATGGMNLPTVAVAISENQRAEVREGMAVRRLTPRECERLQGWPDSWTAYRADGSEIPDGPRYRMIGNGVVSTVSFWIANRIRRVLENTEPVDA